MLRVSNSQDFLFNSIDVAAMVKGEQEMATAGSADLSQEHPFRRLSKHCHLVGLLSPGTSHPFTLRR